MPLNRHQRAALRRAVHWELRWGLSAVSRELTRWRTRATSIPDEQRRADALVAIDTKRGHTDGAALFWTLAPTRNLELLRLLTSYEVIYDYLDNLSEREAHVGIRHGQQMYRALADAVEPSRPAGDWFRHSPRGGDGGYLAELVATCRNRCSSLPSLAVVQPLLDVETARSAVLAINHDPDPVVRDDGLRAFAHREFADDHGMAWYELTAAASQSVVTFVLLAAAADPDLTPEHARRLYDAYFPWFAYGVTMLDSYVDQIDDERYRAHSYVGHYPSHSIAVERLAESARRSADNLLGLPNGERHGVLLACMIAMYLSKDSARSSDLLIGTKRIVAAGGSLTALLLPVLRLWRVLNNQTSR